MDTELLPFQIAQQQGLPLCNLPPLESFNCPSTYNPSLDSNLSAIIHHSLFDIVPPVSKPLLFSSKLEGFPSLPNSEEMEDLGLSTAAAAEGGGPALPTVPLTAKQRKASLAETLRRKNMSKWFSKLEILLPPDDIIKFDRCSLIDATISYIRKLQKTISEAQGEERGSRDGVGSEGKRQRAAEECEEGGGAAEDSSMEATAAEDSSMQATAAAACEKEVVISMSGDSQHAFVNAVTYHTDPVLFSTMLSVLHQHHLDVLNAHLTRSADKFVFSVYAKIPSTMVDYNHQHLKDHLSRVFTSLRKA